MICGKACQNTVRAIVDRQQAFFYATMACKSLWLSSKSGKGIAYPLLPVM
jgi:hypothetical protein